MLLNFGNVIYLLLRHSSYVVRIQKFSTISSIQVAYAKGKKKSKAKER